MANLLGKRYYNIKIKKKYAYLLITVIIALIIILGNFIWKFFDLEFHLKQFVISKNKEGLKVIRSTGSDFEDYWLLFDYKGDYLRLRDGVYVLDSGPYMCAVSGQHLDDKSIGLSETEMCQYYEEGLFYRLDGRKSSKAKNIIKGVENYTILIRKNHHALIISDGQDISFYCSRMNSLLKDLDLSTFTGREIKKFVLFHLTNHYDSYEIISNDNELIDMKTIDRRSVKRNIGNSDSKFRIGKYDYKFVILRNYFDYDKDGIKRINQYYLVSFSSDKNGNISIKEKVLSAPYTEL